MSLKKMPATRRLLAQWDASSNPIFLAAAGQLRAALRSDGRNDVAEVDPHRSGHEAKA
jgi:hypothetical protein